MESAPIAKPSLSSSGFKTPDNYFTEKPMQNTWICNKYVSNQGLHESIREIIQNQSDGLTSKYLNNFEAKPLDNKYEFDFKLTDETSK